MFQRGQAYQSIESIASSSSASSSTRRDSGSRSGHAAQNHADRYNGRTRNGGNESLRSWLPGQGRLRSYLFRRNEGTIDEEQLPMPSLQESWQQSSLSSEVSMSHDITISSLASREDLRRRQLAPSELPRTLQEEEDDRSNWMPDETRKSCFHCGSTFNLVRRRHHCRLCGQIFCHECSSNFVAGKTINRPKEERSRVCGSCVKHVGEHSIQDPTSFRLASLLEPAETGDSLSPSSRLGGGSTTRLISETPQAPDQDEDESDADSTTRSERTKDGQEESDDEDQDLDFNPSGTIDANIAAIWAAARTPAAIEMDREDSPLPSQSPLWDPRDGFLPSILPRGQRELGLPAAALQNLGSVQEQDLGSGVEMRAAAKRHEEAWRKIADEAFRHFARSVRACCQRMGNGLDDSKVILSLCELARQVTDHIAPLDGDLMDILSYVKIKRIPGGSITDSQWIDGVVFSRDVAHRKMATCLSNCHIVLLGDSVSFDNDDRHTILNELHKQEDRSLGNKVQKIADLQPTPQVLLCQGGVSQMARTKLREKNISLILGVPPHILKAIERCTGANVLRAVESIEIRENAVAAVGQSRFFAVQHTGDVGSKPLAVIECSASSRNRCCTICLRGGGTSPEEDAKKFLSHTKRVLRWATRLARHLQLESKFLFEVWCEPRPKESPELVWQKLSSQLEEYQSSRFCEICHSQYKSPEPSSGMCCGKPVRIGYTPNAPVPKTFDEVLRGESLDLLCYSVWKADLTCSRPISFCLPAYVSPDCEPEAPKTNFPNGLGWAGGLDVQPLQGIRDCTLQEWLRRCFRDKDTSAAPTPQQNGECFPAPGLRSDTRHDANDTQPSVSGDGGTTGFNGQGYPRGGVGLDMSGSGFYREPPTENHVRLHHNRLAHGEPPVPTKGEVLCFQHLRSRIVVELRDHDDPLRGRTSSDFQRGASTRWSLLQNRPEESLSASQAEISFKLDGQFNPDSCSSPVLSSNVQSADSSSDSFEVWRWCRCCKNHHVTPRHALSSSAGWLSFAKFLEMLLHNSTSKCCPLATSEGEPCTHSAFRDHVIFFASPQRPVVVGFKWERIDAWRLQPPNLPLWDPETFALEEDANPPETENSTPNLKHDNCETLKSLYHELVQSIDAFLDCALSALSVVKDDDNDSLGMGGQLSRTANSVGSRSSANIAAQADDFESDSPLPIGATCTQSAFPRIKNLPPWLRGWVWAHKGKWHRAISQSWALQAYLRKQLITTQSRIESGRFGNDVDPIVVGFVQRDLLEGLGESSVRAVCAELSALKKLPSSPQIEDSPEPHERLPQEQQQGISAFPVPHAISNLREGVSNMWEGARAALLSNWTTPAGHAESQNEAYAPEDRRRSRSKSQTRSRIQSSMQRSNSFGGFVSELEADWRCAPRKSSRHDASEHDTKLWNLSDDLPRALKDLVGKLEEAVRDEEKLQQASLPRGVLNLSLPVHEDDVGSVISYALLSCETEFHMKSQWERVLGKNGGCPLCGLHGSPTSSCFFSLPNCLRADARTRTTSSFALDSCLSQISDVSLITQSMPKHDSPSTNRLPANNWKRLPALFGEERPLACQTYSWEKEWEQLGVRSVLTADMSKVPSIPVKLETLKVGNTEYTVTIHHAPQFHILRHWLCGDDLNFVRSLHRCTSIRPSGGKSGASFFISDDKRFLVKAVNKHEFKFLKEKGEALFRYADQVLFDKLPSVLAQVLGVFSIVRRGKTKQESWTKNYIVQRNLRYNLWSRPHNCFDLKGVGKNRRVAGTALPVPEERQLEDDDDGITGSVGLGVAAESVAASMSGLDVTQQATSSVDVARTGSTEAAPTPASKSVLWDQNFREWRDGKPLCLPEWDLKYLEAAIWNDTCLLSGQSLVDYSMLLAAAPPESTDSMKAYGTVAIGLIDYLRPYTLDKQAETMFKTIVNGQATVIEPSDYSRRFRQAMGTFFVAENPSPKCD